jgi:hypothetical protein
MKVTKVMKKRVISVFLAIVMLLAAIPTAAVAQAPITPTNIPTGSRAIRTRSQLVAIGSSTANLGRTYHLAADIDLGDEPWVPIGTERTPFTGIFDGRGFTISNMNITGEHTNAGLFGVASFNAVIRNLGVSGTIDMIGNVDDAGTAGGTAGGIVGLGAARTGTAAAIRADRRGAARAEDSVSANTGGNISVDGRSVGPQIINSYADVEIVLSSTLRTHSAGGVIGRYGSVSHSYSLGSVSTLNGAAGGIGGRFTYVRNSYNRGDITSTFGYAGGIVGFGERCGGAAAANRRYLGVVTDSYNAGRVMGGTAATPAVPAVGAAGGIGGNGIVVHRSFWLEQQPAVPVVGVNRQFISDGDDLESDAENAPFLSRSYPIIAMRNRETAAIAATYIGWDFRNTANIYTRPWTFADNTEFNDGLPVLRTSAVFAEIHCTDCFATEWSTGGTPWSVWVTEIDVSCTVDGRQVRICNGSGGSCNALQYEHFPALGHEWSDWRVVTAATCTEEGLQSRVCTTAACALEEEESLPIIDHNFGDWLVTPPTDTEDGERARVCRGCGYIDSRVIPALGGEPCEYCCEDPCVCFCEICREDPCECPCETCDMNPCTCACVDCGEYPCECCDECEEFPCECPCETCGGSPCECCTDCSGFPCKCCEDCGEYPCECPEVIECEESPTGQHIWGDWETVVEPCCESIGSRMRGCRHCDLVVHGAISAVGHRWGEWRVISEPDYDIPGVRERLCANCNQRQRQPMAALVPARKLGDVVGTGEQPTVADALLVLRFLVGLSSLEGDALNAARITGAPLPTVNDALAILRFVVGLSGPLDEIWK